MTPLFEIEAWFNENPPTKTCKIELGAYVMIPKTFVEFNISILKANPGNRNFKPYYDRLLIYYNFDRHGIVPESHKEHLTKTT